MATEQWIGPSGTAWATDGDWESGGVASTPPTAADTAVLGSGDSGTITGPGSAGALDVAGT
jgi:hypothetical protein